MPTLHLTDAEQARLAHAATVLLSPLDHPSADDWRRAVNRALSDLVGADSAGFLLPGVDGPLMYSEEHDPALLARYPDLHPPPLADGTTIWERLLAQRVSTMPTAYGDDVARYVGSDYYHEYAEPNGAADTLCTMLPLGGADPRHVVSVQLWRARGNGRRFAERDRRTVLLLVPALIAGVELVARWRDHRGQVAGVLDSLGHCARLCELTGAIVHQTPALGALLAADPDAATLRAALTRAVAAVARCATDRRRAGSHVAPVEEIRTPSARYRVRACLHHAARPLVLTIVDRLDPVERSPESLRERWGLTPAESRVALLLAKGLSNRDVAERLDISPFTARRHTERVLAKLGVAGRAAVAARLQE